MPKQPVVNARQFIRFLSKLGYHLDRQSGSHMVFEKCDERGQKLTPIAIPYHSGDKLPTGMVHDVISQISVENNISKERLIEMLNEI